MYISLDLDITASYLLISHWFLSLFNPIINIMFRSVMWNRESKHTLLADFNKIISLNVSTWAFGSSFTETIVFLGSPWTIKQAVNSKKLSIGKVIYIKMWYKKCAFREAWMIQRLHNVFYDFQITLAKNGRILVMIITSNSHLTDVRHSFRNDDLSVYAFVQCKIGDAYKVIQCTEVYLLFVSLYNRC